jgi:hypothetical protein
MSNYYEPSGRVEDAPLGREEYREADTMHAPPGSQQQQYAPPPQQMYGYGMPTEPRLRRQYPIETKPFFLTSEFAAALLAVVALAITAAASESIDAWRFWLLASGITAAYLLSRGIAKSGTRSNASDPREQMNLSWPRGGSDREHR